MSNSEIENSGNSYLQDESAAVCGSLPGVSLFLLDHSGEENKTVRDIAADLQITGNLVVDVLKRLDETGLIQLKRNRIVIKDPDSLKDLSMISN